MSRLPAAGGGFVVWLTGLSGSGKSTVAGAFAAALRERGLTHCMLDGDVVRKGLCADLGFSLEDRHENVRRVAEVARIVGDMGAVAIVALISPLRSDRELARSIVGSPRFLEVFIDTPLTVCRERDPKGLYLRADRGELPQFTGVSSPYEPPAEPDLRIETLSCPPAEAAARLLEAARARQPA